MMQDLIIHLIICNQNTSPHCQCPNIHWLKEKNPHHKDKNTSLNNLWDNENTLSQN